MELLEFLQEHILSVTGIALCLFFLIEEEISSYRMGRYRVDADEVLNLKHKGAIIHDIRDRESYQKGHIEGAKHSFSTLLQDKPESILDKNKKHIIYCSTGAKSCEMAALLREKRGFDVYNLSGGLEAWQEAGFTLIKAKGK